MTRTGRLNATGLNCSLSNIYMYWPAAASATYAIDLSPGSTLIGGYIDGFNGQEASPSLCNAVKAAGTTVSGMRVRRLGGTANGIVSTSSSDIITSNHCGELNGGTAFVKVANTTFWGNSSNSGTSHLTRVIESIELPLMSFRKGDANNHVPNSAANGGVLASDTTPLLRASLSSAMQEVRWSAGTSDRILTSIPVPIDLDEMKDMFVDLSVYTDNAGGGGIDAATFSVWHSWDAAGAIEDVATDSSPSTTVHTITATIDDVDAGAKSLSLVLIPHAHANDPIQVTGVRVRYTRMLASV
jgi:hypothetical protein